MKKIIISILCFGLLLGCSKNTDINAGKKTGKLTFKTTKTTEQLQNDISGRWMWQIKKEGKVTGIGAFEWKDSKGALEGFAYTFFLVNENTPNQNKINYHKDRIVVLPITGIRKGNKLEFEAKSASGNIIKNQCIVQNGTRIIGKSTQFLSAEEKLNNPQVDFRSYEWSATRLTDSSPLITNYLPSIMKIADSFPFE